MVQYLHFRILEFPLKYWATSWNDDAQCDSSMFWMEKHWGSSQRHGTRGTPSPVYIPSGKLRLQQNNCGKAPKLYYNLPFAIAMLNYQRDYHLKWGVASHVFCIKWQLLIPIIDKNWRPKMTTSDPHFHCLKLQFWLQVDWTYWYIYYIYIYINIKQSYHADIMEVCSQIPRFPVKPRALPMGFLAFHFRYEKKVIDISDNTHSLDMSKNPTFIYIYIYISDFLSWTLQICI